LLTIPAVIAGVAIVLWLTRTTLNIQSFMGVIMAIGVAVANAIMLVTFAERQSGRGPRAMGGSNRRGRQPSASDPDDQLRDDRRMIPMALGLSEGGEANGPPWASGNRRPYRRYLRHTHCFNRRFSPHSSRGTLGFLASLDPDDPNSPYFELAPRLATVSGAANRSAKHHDHAAE